jgi:RNA polymerase sigma factor (sigma-70 family)
MTETTAPADEDLPDAPEDDAALAERCRSGERSAWIELVNRYQRLVYTVARRAGCDEATAADVFQATFEQLWSALDRLRQPERLRAWIVTVAKREALRHRYAAQRQVAIDELEDAGLEIPDTAPLAPQVLEQLQDMHRLQAAMSDLDARCRQLLELLFDEPAPPYEHIAQTMGMPIGSLGPTRSRCLGKLRRLMEAA